MKRAWVCAMALGLLTLASNANANTFTTLLSFDGANGANPYGNLTLSADGSTLYGMTSAGGAGGAGNIFSIQTDGSGYRNVLSFGWSTGSTPMGSLTLSGAKLYGMTSQGGEYAGGNVFSIYTDGSGFQNLYSFSGLDGYNPLGNLALGGSTLYGTTSQGGANGDGNVFSISTGGADFKNLFSFNGTNGQSPNGYLALGSSTLVGMTSQGSTYGDGNLFSINTDGTGFREEIPFTSPGSVIATSSPGASANYAMFPFGGSNNEGKIIAIPTDGPFRVQTLLSFDGANGAFPYGQLTVTADGSTLYGMTSQGGAYGDGTVFRLDLTQSPQLSQTPEPCSMVLLGTGALGFIGYVRRKRMK